MSGRCWEVPSHQSRICRRPKLVYDASCHETKPCESEPEGTSQGIHYPLSAKATSLINRKLAQYMLFAGATSRTL